ncbi:tetraacyldisaccharide 4'-kinase [Geobacter sp.]|uniref:tetraacyldisaccharide 4'-kinase n=1 Tax=Geobacter sp. TaxID=46610 RepID=UPI0027B992F5|nr:tetraacyldisaccharide 4'-kinase [Geobacter sp.]
MSFEGYFRSLVSGERRGLVDRLLLAFLVMFSVPYGIVVRLRALAYAKGIFRVHRLNRPVISVGNLTVGGTGKTPMVALVTRLLMERGKRVAVISRGYGGSLEGEMRIVSDGYTVFLTAAEAGDEPVHLATAVPGLMAVIGSDRHAAGRLALEQLNPDVFILDDGFQHLRLHRDLNILLMDCRSPLGNGHTLPAGLLREPPSALKRADLVVYTRCAGVGAPSVHGTVPSCRAGHSLTGVELLPSGDRQPFEKLRGRRGVAFAGIAEPEAFFASLRDKGVDIVATVPFDDHCRYGEPEVARLAETCRTAGADFLITTGKDAVKLTPLLGGLGPVYVAVLEMRLIDLNPLETAIDKVL